MTWLLLLGVLLSDATSDGRLNTLPDWSHSSLQNFKTDAINGDLIRLLDRNVIYYKGDGKLYLHRQVVQVVQHPRAVVSASQISLSGNDEGSKLIGFNAWHLKPGGFSEELDKRDLVIYGGGAFGSMTSQTMSYGQFSHVGRGSIIVFETREEIKSFLGTVSLFPVGSEHYTQTYRFELKDVSTDDVPAEFVIEPWGLAAWGLKARQDGNGFLIEKIPAMPHEPDVYRDPTSHPGIFVNAFIKGENRYLDWHAFAKWYYGIFASKAYPEGQPDLTPANLKRADLEPLTSQVRDRVTYRQVYLSHARGWEPLPGKDVIHRAYGDCKDMVAALAYVCEEKQIPVLPVIANIVDGMYTGKEHPANPFFNHLISAIPLAESLGLDSEVLVEGKRYLIIETTSKSTPLGKLPEAYRNRQLLICTPEGAVWADVPDQAIEHNQIQLRVDGTVDKAMKLMGTIELTATGDPGHLRARVMHHGGSGILPILSNMLDLPANANLELVDSQINNDDQIKIKAKVSWPTFLYADEDGYRLPSGLIYDEWQDIAAVNRPRVNPYKLESMPVWDVQINVRTATALDVDRKTIEEDFGPLSYRFTSRFDDKMNLLSIDFQFKSKSVIFKKHETSKARAFWNKFTTDYNRMWRSEMLFHRAS